MTRQEATDFIEKMKEMYGDEYREELARRTGCNPDNYDDYGLVYCMQFNTMSRGRVAPRARAMKGHGQDLFKESIQRATKKVRLTEGDLRRIVKESVKKIVNEWSNLRPKPEIENIEFIDDGDVVDREVIVTLSNGTEIHIVPCYESWEQYGGTEDELRITVPIANKCNRWLHGSRKRPLF